MVHLIKRHPAVASYKAMRMLGIAGFMLALVPALACTAQQSAAPAAPSDGQPHYGGVLDMAYIGRADPSDLDPISGSGTTYGFIMPAYSGLLQFDPLDQEKIIPDLAERWEVSPDGKVYTFYLRKGIKWHDGTPFTAADVKYTWDRVLDPKDPRSAKFGGKRNLFEVIQRSETPDDLTIKAYLGDPSNSFLSRIAVGISGIAPKHAYDSVIEGKNLAMGTGPYILKEWQRGVVVNLVKNPNYFMKDRPYLDGINIYFLKDNAARIGALQTGQLKLLRGVPQKEVDTIVDGFPQAVITKNNSLRWGYIGMVYNKAPFNDVRIRRAIHLALDRQAGITVLAPGDGELGGILPPGSELAIPSGELAKMPGYRTEKAQDIVEAKRLLAEAGFPNGFKTKILVSPPLVDGIDLAVFAKDQLAKIGMDLNVDVPGAGDTRRQQSNFDLIASVAGSNLADPLGGALYYGEDNYMLFKDDIFHGLLLKQDRTLDPAERKKLLRQMQDRFLELAHLSVVYWKQHASVMWPEVRNLKEGIAVHNNYKMQDVWLAK